MDLLARLALIVGEKGVRADPEEILPLLLEPRGLYCGKALAVIFPKTVAEVAATVAVCNEAGVGVVPQGGNTGLVGGQTPDESGRQIILSLKRLDRIREVDPASDTMTLEAGVTLLGAQQAAEAADRYFPLSLAAEGSCTIGGNLATNAGGVHVIAYGSARDLALGVEAVLADGRVLSSLSKLRKDNTGYDLTRLMIGSEGTLGVITAATLKLFPRPRERVTLLAGLADPAAALKLLELFKSRLGSAIQAFELLPRIGIEFVLRLPNPPKDPFPRAYPWYALVDFAWTREAGLEDAVVKAMSQASYGDAVIAASLAQMRELWRLRETLPEAQKREGGSIKHDISVPLVDIPAFIEEASRLVVARVPGARPVPFGHMGDGNIHYNVSQPVDADTAGFLARWEEINDIVHGVALKFGGSLAAEHGVGRLKRELLQRVKDPTALDVMRAIKRSLDPKNTLNPGKVL